MARKKKILPKKILDEIYNCWDESKNRAECLDLISKRIPELTPPVAWGAIRKLSKTEKKWIKLAEKKKIQKEEEKIQKEKKKEEKIKIKQEKELQKDKQIELDRIRNKLNKNHLSKIEEEVQLNFFFCPNLKQQVNNISCIFKVFSSEEEYSFSPCSTCIQCKKMDKYLSIIKKILGENE